MLVEIIRNSLEVSVVTLLGMYSERRIKLESFALLEDQCGVALDQKYSEAFQVQACFITKNQEFR